MTAPTVPDLTALVARQRQQLAAAPDPLLAGLLDEQRRDYVYPSEPPLACDGPAYPTAGGTS
jgi:hypothetical protein